MSGDARPEAAASPAASPGPAENRRTLAGLARKQSRAHRAMALLIEKEVRLHVFLKKLADQAAGQQIQERSTKMLRMLGDKHVEQEETGRKEIWAHTQLAASTEARALGFERLIDLEPGLGEDPPFRDIPETSEAAEARHLLDRHAQLVKGEETGRRRDVALTRLALGRLKRRQQRGLVSQGLVGKTLEDDTLRARRWTQSSRTHFAMARILDKQGRAHQLLATLIEREAAALAFLAPPAEPRNAAGAGAADRGNAGPGTGEHPWARLKAASNPRPVAEIPKPTWAHQRLAARCAARAAWHQVCASYLATSLETSGARPPRAAGRRPGWTERS